MFSFLWEDTRSISFKFWFVQRNTFNFGPCLKKTTGFTFFAVTVFLGCFSCWNITGMALICLNNIGFSVLLREVSTAQEHLPLSFLPFPFYPSTHYLSAYYLSMLSSIYLSGNLSSSQSFTCSNSGRHFVSASAFQSSPSLCFPRHCSLPLCWTPYNTRFLYYVLSEFSDFSKFLKWFSSWQFYFRLGLSKQEMY